MNNSKALSSLPLKDKIPSLHILLIVHRRLDEVLITNIIKETTHRLHIVDTPRMIVQCLNIQSFDLALICDNDQLRANQTVQILLNHPNGKSIPTIGINPEKDEENNPRDFDFKTICTLHAPITNQKLSSLLNHYADKIYCS